MKVKVISLPYIFQVLYVLCFTRPRYQVSVYRTIGPLVMIYFQKSTGNDASENAAGFSNLLLLALAAFSTAYNVVLYVIFNPSFKQAIIGVLRCNSVREVNDRVIDEPSQASATMRETETGTTFVIQDGKRHFHNRITPVEVTGDG